MWTDKFKLLCWINWIFIKSHLKVESFKCLLPVIIVLNGILIHNIFDQGKVLQKPTFEFNINIATCTVNSRNIPELWYAPDTEYYRKLMTNVKINMNTKAIKDANELTKQLLKNRKNLVAVVIFEDTASNRLKHLKYTIRMPEKTSSGISWNTDKLYYHGLSSDPRPNSYPNRNLIYHSTCFSMLQNEIDQAFIKASSNAQDHGILKTLMPFPIFFINHGISLYLILFMILLSVLFNVFNLIRNITIERESRLTESMKIMGLSSALYWSSWFMRSFIILLISFTINLILTVTSIISEVPMFANSNPFIIWIFFMSYIKSMITFCFLVSVVFKKSSRAGIVGLFVFIATVIPYIMYHDSFYRFGYGLKVLFCMLTNTNMSQGVKMILMAEVNDGGVGFGNLFKRSVDMKFSFAELLLWMNIGSALQMLLTIYIERVFLGEFGLSKPWHFPLKFIYKRIMKKPTNDNNHEGREMEPLESTSDQEDVPQEQVLAIELKNLSKSFGTNCAVHNLSFKLYENQILVLLGPKDAGKSSVVSMLTGLCQPTLGTAIINGHDIRTDTEEARRSLGVCLQDDVLFKELTVVEHLKIFCKLKGMTEEKFIQEEICKYTNLLGISEKLDIQIKNLNDEEKRKLSVAIALCGDSKFVILDEPTSGMDQSSRKHLWDLLIAEKKNRTILITTHLIDDAETLGDRIAIMSKGQLKVVGSLSFLKTRLKVGYRLTCIKQDGFEVQNVLAVIQELAPCASIEKNEDTEAVFGISEDHLAIFGQIFERLEAESEALRIGGFRIGFVSLEDAIAKLDARIDEPDNPDDAQEATLEQTVINMEQEEPQNDCKLFQQIYAIFLKKLHIHCRSWRKYLFYGIISILAIALVSYWRETEPNEPPNLQISLDSYEETETFVEIDKPSSKSVKYKNLFTEKDEFFAVTDIEEEIVKKYNKSIGTVNHKNLIAATIKSDELIAWFNTQPYHTMPLTVNTINRAILKSAAGNDFDITVSNHPYLITESDAVTSSILSFVTIWVLLPVWPMIYIKSYIKERKEFQQFISGTNRLVYWFTNLVFDYFFFVLICSVLFGGLVCLNYDKEQRLEEFGILMTVGSSYGFSWICFIYAFSYLFSKPSARWLWLLPLSILLSSLSVLIQFLHSEFEFPYIKLPLNILHWTGMIFAPLTLVKMIQVVFSGTRPFDYSTLNEYIVVNIVTGFIFFLFVILNDYNFFTYVYYKLKSMVQKVQNVNEVEQNLVLKEITQMFILTIKTGFTDETRMKELKELVVKKFLDVELKEENFDISIFYLKNTKLKYSEMFRNLAKIKEETSIVSYKLVQMTIEVESKDADQTDSQHQSEVLEGRSSCNEELNDLESDEDWTDYESS